MMTQTVMFRANYRKENERKFSGTTASMIYVLMGSDNRAKKIPLFFEILEGWGLFLAYKYNPFEEVNDLQASI
jgi:hypothetical protein